MSHRDNILPYRWKPGQSGNPAGSSKSRRITATLIELIEERNLWRQLAEVALNAALAGDFRYWKEVIDRVDGPVRPADGGDDNLSVLDALTEAEQADQWLDERRSEAERN
jgi:hypothetical protein